MCAIGYWYTNLINHCLYQLCITHRPRQNIPSNINTLLNWYTLAIKSSFMIFTWMFLLLKMKMNMTPCLSSSQKHPFAFLFLCLWYFPTHNHIITLLYVYSRDIHFQWKISLPHTSAHLTPFVKHIQRSWRRPFMCKDFQLFGKYVSIKIFFWKKCLDKNIH